MSCPFDYQAIGPEQRAHLDELRLRFKAVYELLEPSFVVFDGRYAEQARLALEEAAMWASKAVSFRPGGTA